MVGTKSIALGAFLVLFAGQVLADARNLNCDPDSNVCTVTSVDNYCGLGETAKTRWDMRSDKYVLSCECNCTSQENTFWLINQSDDSSVVLVDASQILTPAEFEKTRQECQISLAWYLIVQYRQSLKGSWLDCAKYQVPLNLIVTWLMIQGCRIRATPLTVKQKRTRSAT